MLAPFLFILYTLIVRSSADCCPWIKFVDDTVLIGLIKVDDDSAYIGQIKTFVDNCGTNSLELSVTKTKELL